MSRAKTYQPITPTYNVILNKALSAVVDSLNLRDMASAWDCLLTLINISPQNVYDEVITEVHRIAKETNRITGHDQYKVMLSRAKLIEVNIRPLLRKIVNLLDAEDLLRYPGVKPRYTERKKLEVPKIATGKPT